MKYKVIGWTYYDNYDTPAYNKQIGFAERNAIIDEIKKHKYLFTGWHHQEYFDNCVPVLNDGKKRMFSQRSFGGIMAEAYGYTEDLDYVRYTFHQSIDNSDLKIPNNEFDIEEFKPEELINEHFDVFVSEGLFDIAKKKNPFYLEDLEELRYIDTNDTITLNYNNESLTFLVSDIDRNKKELKFKYPELISTKYKIIVTHKPIKKVIKRKPYIIRYDEVNDKFKECLDNYDFNILLELFENHNLDDITNKRKNKKTKDLIKRFINEYTQYSFDESLVIKLLRYINDYEYFKEITDKYYIENPNILIQFTSFYLDKNINMDEYIKKTIKVVKKYDYYMMGILLKAIELNPNNKALRKKYYKESHDVNDYGLILMMGLKLYDYLRRDDKIFIDLNNYKKLSSNDIMRLAELLSDSKYFKESDNKYPYRIPSYLNSNNKCIIDGLKEFKEYVNQFNIEEILLYGIDNRISDIEREVDGCYYNAQYVYVLDKLTNFKYNLKDKAINKYGNKYKDLIEELNHRYSK